MEILWEDPNLKTHLEDEDYLKRKYDKKVAKKVPQRLQELKSAPSYAQLPPASHPHPAPNEGEYAVDVPGLGEGRGKLRLIFKPFGSYDPAHVETIIAVTILTLVNYH